MQGHFYFFIKSGLSSSTVRAQGCCWRGSIDTVRSIAAQTIFVVGNVFYQILFSQVQKEPSLAFVNWLYFGAASMSLVVGIAAIVLAPLLVRSSCVSRTARPALCGAS